MKKVSLSVLALALATTAASAANPFQGFYAGVSGGYTRPTLDSSVKVKSILGNASSSKKDSGNGVALEAFLGYGSQIFCSNFYLGGEIGGGYDSARFNKRIALFGGAIQARASLRSSFFYNASARLGYLFSNTLVYTRFGFQSYAKGIKYTVGSDSETLKRNGFVLGVGFDHMCGNNIFVRGEYKYNAGYRYRAKASIVGVSARAEAKTPSHTILFGLGYKL
ncbi:MAG TPA: outer membrane beta-barrel protein [Candidatus Nitrosotenuis sp.]|jgi:opacity protein-like surface antigen|nr:outer membrane beta-barrel protein [Candidatus Nitrosotenuis sp.]